jgi:IS30 family transposase
MVYFGPFLSENQFDMVVRNNPYAHGLCDREEIAMLIGVSRATIQRGLRRDREDSEAKELDKLLKAQRRAARAGKK